MELYQLEYFHMLCKCRSYTKTAQAFHVTQPAVTTALKKLEQECGAALIDRTGKRFSLTPLGETLFRHADNIHGELACIRAEITKYTQGGREVINLALPLTMCPKLLPEISAKFIPSHPEISVLCSQTGPETVVDGLEHEDYHIGISCMDLRSSELKTHPFDQVEFCAFFSAEHPFAHYDCITSEMLSDQALLLPQTPTGVAKSIHTYFDRYHITPQYLSIGNIVPHDSYALAQMGKGIAILPKHISDRNRASLHPPLFVELGVMWRRGRRLSAGQQALVRFLLDCAGEAKGVSSMPQGIP